MAKNNKFRDAWPASVFVGSQSSNSIDNNDNFWTEVAADIHGGDNSSSTNDDDND